MHSQQRSLSTDAAHHGKFASPMEDLFIQNQHVGTVYKWDDGLETTIWSDGSKPAGECISKPHLNKRLGWRDFFDHSP